jgi:hypothetical protein
MPDDVVYWPFRVVEPDGGWSEFHRDFIDFMQKAYAEGFRPRHRGETMIEAENADGRRATLIRRERNSWEPLLGDGDTSLRLGPAFSLPYTAGIFVRPRFRAAGYLALEWLRGRSLVSILDGFDFDGKRSLELRPGHAVTHPRSGV